MVGQKVRILLMNASRELESDADFFCSRLKRRAASFCLFCRPRPSVIVIRRFPSVLTSLCQCVAFYSGMFQIYLAGHANQPIRVSPCMPQSLPCSDSGPSPSVPCSNPDQTFVCLTNLNVPVTHECFASTRGGIAFNEFGSYISVVFVLS
jgi:hypothetical protein